jgi:excisionase family DNA binding protein
MRQQPTISPDTPPAFTRRHLRRRRTAVSERLLSQEEAARLAGCSKDTIVRARRNGRLPNARLRDRRWAIPIDDLAAAGLYDLEGPETAARAERIETDPGAEPDAVQLARALARVAALEDLVARQDDQLAFLRQLTVDTLAKRGAF